MLGAMEDSFKHKNLMIFGVHPVMEAIKSGQTFDKVLVLHLNFYWIQQKKALCLGLRKNNPAK